MRSGRWKMGICTDIEHINTREIFRFGGVCEMHSEGYTVLSLQPHGVMRGLSCASSIGGLAQY